MHNVKIQIIFILKVKIRSASPLGCYNSPLLELDFVLEVGRLEQLRIMLLHLHLQLPGPLRAFSMLPLNLYQRYLLVAQNIHLTFHYRYRSPNIIQALIDLNIIQGDHCLIAQHALPQL